jgi:hypothetical protein
MRNTATNGAKDTPAVAADDSRVTGTAGAPTPKTADPAGAQGFARPADMPKPDVPETRGGVSPAGGTAPSVNNSLRPTMDDRSPAAPAGGRMDDGLAMPASRVGSVGEGARPPMMLPAPPVMPPAPAAPAGAGATVTGPMGDKLPPIQPPAMEPPPGSAPAPETRNSLPKPPYLP